MEREAARLFDFNVEILCEKEACETPKNQLF
jgi:hypothetical protein